MHIMYINHITCKQTFNFFLTILCSTIKIKAQKNSLRQFVDCKNSHFVIPSIIAYRHYTHTYIPHMNTCCMGGRCICIAFSTLVGKKNNECMKNFIHFSNRLSYLYFKYYVDSSSTLH